MKRAGDLETVRRRAEHYAARIGIRDFVIPTEPRGDGSPYLEIDEDYNFVFEERGVERRRWKTKDIEELMYWIFKVVISDIAGRFELLNRRTGEDPRRQWFSKQEELLGLASEAWAARKAKEHQAILARSPFRDDIG
ncbi:Imm63 family immunity protein [Oharaeibacter diazotrophicus]|uniref:Immunity protein 63 of polymorphic toxin system n=1 Tax=Oharaeibacter diazotrophicus TaxID=1920512 RepID=A0A4R6R5I4_9HYPH|nr:Imm63 family immunity protein [Oharaeibacter diazotrophicus]TDP81153.1 immunity protein 63 of polymorphic toxin system [Oharaeibacter diazotrophicus]BBE74853.1 hypothetical protein OHA_2_00055 [Pleomorphomonas sp. SM30]GLS75643.1 hypothetical protein GCM10007904_09780 [Oharaeibacter diazotrophicus]